MLNLEIDKLTNSIEHAVTGETFETLVVQVEASNLKSLGVRSWVFDWEHFKILSTQILINHKQISRLLADFGG